MCPDEAIPAPQTDARVNTNVYVRNFIWRRKRLLFLQRFRETVTSPVQYGKPLPLSSFLSFLFFLASSPLCSIGPRGGATLLPPWFLVVVEVGRSVVVV